MYSLVEVVVASSLIIWGLSLIINKHIVQSFYNAFTNIEKNEILIYLTASMFLILGLITVSVHNDWYLNPAIIVTLIGWIITIKSSLWLFFPRLLTKITKKSSVLILNSWFRFVYGAIIILLGMIVFVKHYVENFTI